MPLAHIRRKDTVIVISGRERGKRGEVIRVLPEKGRVFIAKVNLIKRHMRPNPKHPQGGIVEKEAALHMSNVRVVCPKCDKGTRVRKKILADGSAARMCARCGETLTSK